MVERRSTVETKPEPGDDKPQKDTDIHDLVRVLSATAAVHRKLVGALVHDDSADHARAGELCLRLATELPVMHDHDLATQFQFTAVDEAVVRQYVTDIGISKFPRNARELLEALLH